MNKGRLKQYLEIFILAACILIFYKLLNNISVFTSFFSEVISILQSFIIGGCLAYLLCPFSKKMEKLLERSKNEKILKRKNSLSIMLSYVIFIILLVVVLRFLIPAIVNNVIEFMSKLDDCFASIIEFADEKITDPSIQEQVDRVILSIEDMVKEYENFDFSELVDTIVSSVGLVFNIVIGFILCPYILLERKNLVHIFDSVASIFVNDHIIEKIHYYAYQSHLIFSNFIYGKAIDSLIIGLIAFVFFNIMDYNFAVVYALVIGVTNMIPYFGPFIGGIPVTIVVLITEGVGDAIACGVFIFLLQQFDGYILGPHILGDKVGVGPFWIIFSITFFGGLFGVLGMFVGVPLIAIIRMLLRDFIDYRKKKRKNPKISSSSS